MKRVLRLTAIVFGIGLIGVTGMLAYTRSTHEPNPLLVHGMREDIQHYHQRAYLSAIGSDIQRPITPTHDNFDVIGWSPDKAWFYWTAARDFDDTQINQGEAWRISRDGRHVERLKGVIFQQNVSWSPDGQWIYYDYWTTQQTRELYRVRPNGENIQHLTAAFDHDVMRPHVSWDGRWVYFTVWNNPAQREDLYRMPADGGTSQNLTEALGGTQLIVLVWPEVDESLVIATTAEINGWLQTYLWIEETATWYPIYDPIATDSLYAHWVPDWNILILLAAQTTMGIDMKMERPVWEYTNTRQILLTDDHDWVYVSILYKPLFRMHPNGTGYTEFPNAPLEGYVQYVAPDGRFIIYQGLHIETASFWFYKLDIASGESHPVYGDGWLVTSDSSGWMVIQHKDGTFAALHPQSEEVQSLRLGKYPGVILTLLPPIDRAWSPIRLLVMGSVLMLGGVIRQRGKSTL